MKKLITLLIIAMALGATAQDSTATVYDQVKESATTFEEAVAPYVQKLMRGVETGVDFAVRETPIVIRQYLVYEAIFHWTWILISVSMVIGGWSLMKSTINSAKEIFENTVISEKLSEWDQGHLRDKRDRELESSKWGALVFFGVVSVIAFVIFSLNIFSAIKVTFFPKLYLVQEFINLF